jgi:biopolymer transport protein ExbD
MRHRPNNSICKINVTGFASAMVALPYLFMYRQIDIDSAHHQVGPELPRVSHPVSMPHADGEGAIVVAITRDGKVWVTEVLNRVRSTGVDQIGFLVEQRKTPDSTTQ